MPADRAGLELCEEQRVPHASRVAYCLAYHLDQLHGQRSSWLGRGELPVRALIARANGRPNMGR